MVVKTEEIWLISVVGQKCIVIKTKQISLMLVVTQKRMLVKTKQIRLVSVVSKISMVVKETDLVDFRGYCALPDTSSYFTPQTWF